MSNENSPRADMCRVDIVRVVFTEYDQVDGENLFRIEVPVWSALVGGDTGEINYRRFPEPGPTVRTQALLMFAILRRMTV